MREVEQRQGGQKPIKTTTHGRQALTISLQHGEHIWGTDWGGC